MEGPAKEIASQKFCGMLLDGQLNGGGAAEGSRNRIHHHGIGAGRSVGAQGRADGATSATTTVVVA